MILLDLQSIYQSVGNLPLLGVICKVISSHPIPSHRSFMKMWKTSRNVLALELILSLDFFCKITACCNICLLFSLELWLLNSKSVKTFWFLHISMLSHTIHITTDNLRFAGHYWYLTVISEHEILIFTCLISSQTSSLASFSVVQY